MKKSKLDAAVKGFRKKVEMASASVDDTEAVEIIELFPKWESGRSVSVGERFQYSGKLYKCVQAHTTQSDWTPDITPALWVVVSIEEYPEWIQPIGAHDAYAAGAKVSHNGKHWISTVDSNVWEPGVYGWNEN